MRTRDDEQVYWKENKKKQRQSENKTKLVTHLHPPLAGSFAGFPWESPNMDVA